MIELKQYRLFMMVIVGMIIMTLAFKINERELKQQIQDLEDQNEELHLIVNNLMFQLEDYEITINALEHRNNELEEEIKILIKSMGVSKREATQEISGNRSNPRVIIYNQNSRIDSASGLTAAQIDTVLKDTKMAGLGEAFIKAETKYNVNAVFLVAIAALESGWGQSNYAVNRNNLFGFGAFDHNPDNARHFRTKEEGIMVVAKWLQEQYLHKDGAHYNGATPKGVNIKYSSCDEWSVKVVNIMNRIVSRATN